MPGIINLLIVICVLLTTTSNAEVREICNTYCDGRDPSLSSNDTREVVSAITNSRQITLVISNLDNMGFAKISNGNPGDEVWLDRSFDGGLDWTNGSKLGYTSIPNGSKNGITLMYNVDDDKSLSDNNGLGSLRACGKPGDIGEVICTEWARSNVWAKTPIEAAATALMQYYDGKLWHTIGWWNSANAFTALMNYMRLTGSVAYLPVIESTFIKNLDGWDGNFTSDSLDDTEWWALAWIEAYDLTGVTKYLDMAILDYEYIYQYVDDVCGGGVWWSIYRTYKNAITNELLIQIAAALHNRIPGDTRYLNHAIQLWTWFKQSGMINSENLINDGLTDTCVSNRDTTWTYNQGVILGALVELHKGTNNNTYLDEAIKIADAVINSPLLSPYKILKEPCGNGGGCGGGNACDCNQISFKGIFMRHLGELNRNLPGRPYESYIILQGASNYINNKNALNQYGMYYAGPFEENNAGTQQSALEAFTAAI